LTLSRGGETIHLRMSSQPPGAGSGVFFYREAADLERSLRADPSPRAKELVVEAKRLAKVFDDWSKLRAEPSLKAATIRQLFELNRAVLEYLSASGRRPTRQLVSTEEDDDEG
jgi:hypothetical protein